MVIQTTTKKKNKFNSNALIFSFSLNMGDYVLTLPQFIQSYILSDIFTFNFIILSFWCFHRYSCLFFIYLICATDFIIQWFSEQEKKSIFLVQWSSVAQLKTMKCNKREIYTYLKKKRRNTAVSAFCINYLNQKKKHWMKKKNIWIFNELFFCSFQHIKY